MVVATVVVVALVVVVVVAGSVRQSASQSVDHVHISPSKTVPVLQN